MFNHVTGEEMKSLQRLIIGFIFSILSIGAFAQSEPTKRLFAEWVQDAAIKPISKSTAKTIVDAVYENAKKHRIDPLLILSMMNVESGFRPDAKNKTGASGLMQVIPFWHRDKIAGRNILNVRTNVEVGTAILQECLSRNKDHFAKSISCYSGGASSAYTKKIRAIYVQLRNMEVEMRFAKELPIEHYAVFGKPRLPEIKEPQERPIVVVAQL